VLAASFCTVLAVLAAIDLERRIVPNRIVVPAAAVALVARTTLDPSLEWIAAALTVASFFLAAALVYPAGMGMGDVKLSLLLGAMLGRVVAVGVIVALTAAFALSVALLARHGAKARKSAIPFAPFLASGGVVALFWGESLLGRG
jgi:leader peptidase (prepilin peptidase)/N-methyltransferase